MPNSTVSSNIKHLPFVADIGKGKNKQRTFWHVTPNGNYDDECVIGKDYARRAIAYMQEQNFTPLLGWIVLAIQDKSNHSGIEIGFMSVIAEHAIGAQ